MSYAQQRRTTSRRASQSGLPAPLRFLSDHQISAALLLLFALSLFGQSITGYRAQPPGTPMGWTAYAQYLASGDFWETVAENWEGEFLPLAAYVFFTMWLYERGAKESRKSPQRGVEKTDIVRTPEVERSRADAPWPLKIGGRIGGVIRWVYLHSILLAFLLIFLLAVVVHATMGLEGYNATLLAQHQPQVSIVGYVVSDTFWLQSTRNWEAGFFSTAMLVIFSIFLRQQRSPVSKAPDQPTKATAEEGEDNG